MTTAKEATREAVVSLLSLYSCFTWTMERSWIAANHSVVVVPGFFGTLTGGRIVSLGRGGSDLSAVLLSHEFAAERCELIKNVAGYFTEDPDTTSGAEHLPWVSYETALEMAQSGCGLVQPLALEIARERSLRLVVRSLCDTAPGTVVSRSREQQGLDQIPNVIRIP